MDNREKRKYIFNVVNADNVVDADNVVNADPVQQELPLQHLQHNNIGVIPHTRRQKNEKRYEYIGNQERVGHEAVLNGVHESGDRAE